MGNQNILPAVKRALLRQGGIFLCYLFLCSLLLRNHSSIADIVFAVYMAISFLIHIIIVLIVAMVQRRSVSPTKCNTEDIVVLFLMGVLLAWLGSYYIQFVWWLTGATGCTTQLYLQIVAP